MTKCGKFLGYSRRPGAENSTVIAYDQVRKNSSVIAYDQVRKIPRL